MYVCILYSDVCICCHCCCCCCSCKIVCCWLVVGLFHFLTLWGHKHTPNDYPAKSAAICFRFAVIIFANFTHTHTHSDTLARIHWVSGWQADRLTASLLVGCLLSPLFGLLYRSSPTFIAAQSPSTLAPRKTKCAIYCCILYQFVRLVVRCTYSACVHWCISLYFPCAHFLSISAWHRPNSFAGMCVCIAVFRL